PHRKASMHQPMLGTILAKLAPKGRQHHAAARVAPPVPGMPSARQVRLMQDIRSGSKRCFTAAVAFLVACMLASTVQAAKVVLRDGRVIEGRIAPIPSMLADPSGINEGG